MNEKLSFQELEEMAEFAKNLAIETGNMVEQMRQATNFEINYKGKRDHVTNADCAADALIVNSIKDKYPSHKFISEEVHYKYEGLKDFSGIYWVIDPIDGTTNFVQNIPQYAVSIAVAIDGQVEIAVVYCPALKQVFSAIKGKGAFCNGKKISAVTGHTLNRAIVATGFWYGNTRSELATKRLSKILESCHDIRRIGSAAIDLCYVAQGSLDGYYETAKPWDIAAGFLIAKEAGAKIVRLSVDQSDKYLPEDLNGSDYLVANAELIDSLKNILTN